MLRGVNKLAVLILMIGELQFILGAARQCLQAQAPPVAPTPREQLQQYVTQLQANPSDDALRTKIIQLALTLDPKPATPADLPETIGAATYAFKNAQSVTDLVNAANLYAKAALEAPWRADLYFNEGLAFEKAKAFDEAIKAYQFYLLAAPNAADSEAVKENIGALKYQLTQKLAADTAQRQQQAAANERYEEQQREQAELQSMWSGVWRVTGGAEKDPRYRGDSFRHDSYHESHETFTISGNQITMVYCRDKPDNTYHWPEGHSVSKYGQVSDRTASFDLGYGQWQKYHMNGSGQIEVQDSNFPGEIPWIYSLVNDPSAVSPRCSQ